VRRPGAAPTLHQRIERALIRAARAQENSHALIEQLLRTSNAINTTIADTERRKRARAVNGSETDK
jgi:predicted N-formylglutamate amidohydrolase